MCMCVRVCVCHASPLCLTLFFFFLISSSHPRSWILESIPLCSGWEGFTTCRSPICYASLCVHVRGCEGLLWFSALFQLSASNPISVFGKLLQKKIRMERNPVVRVAKHQNLNMFDMLRLKSSWLFTPNTVSALRLMCQLAMGTAIGCKRKKHKRSYGKYAIKHLKGRIKT